MKLNGYELNIVGSRNNFISSTKSITSEGFAVMSHNETYKIKLGNNNFSRCDAVVTIDGSQVGTWRLQPKSSITIERPADIDKNFTFFKVGTSEGNSAGLKLNDRDNGLVQVEFIPETIYKHSDFVLESATMNCKTADLNNIMPQASCRSYGQGGTGLQGKSDQQFGTARKIDRDYNRSTTISVRLVSSTPNDDPMKITPLKRKTRIPPLPGMEIRPPFFEPEIDLSPMPRPRIWSDYPFIN